MILYCLGGNQCFAKLGSLAVLENADKKMAGEIEN